MDEIWEEFGHLSEQELRRYIQDNCPEWESTRRASRANSGKHESKESFPNHITIDTVGEKMGMSQYDIDGIKHSANPWG